MMIGHYTWPRDLPDAIIFSATVFLSGTELFVDPPSIPEICRNIDAHRVEEYTMTKGKTRSFLVYYPSLSLSFQCNPHVSGLFL